MSRDTLEILRTILSDRYRVERLLGSGGMATVYLAHDLKHDRDVAIKVLRPELAAAIGSERFLREIQIAAKLTHPHILPLHDSGAGGGLLYYVMPYVAGETLLDRLSRERQLPVDDAVRIIREVAAALGYAHARDVIHRDIKPGNILLSDGYALVADFGLARAISRAQENTSISQSGLTLGTPAYMSPEQGSGEGELDGRTDIYSLGCVLYELLAGNPPFTASHPGAVLARHAGAEVPPLRGLRADIPAHVERAVRTALEKSPADRFKNAEEFAAALEGPAPVPVRRYGVLTALAAAGLIVLLVLLFRPPPPPAPRVNVDRTRLAVFSLEYPDSTTRPDVETILEAAFARWSGLTLVERSRIEAVTGRGRRGEVDEEQAHRFAVQLNAGRYVRGQVLPSGDSVQVRLMLYDGADGAELAQRTVRLPRALHANDSTVTGLADGLLFRGRLARAADEGPLASLSYVAVTAFLDGESAIGSWDLAAADSAFNRAVQLDPQFAQANLWLAQLRAWQGLPARVWRLQAEQALASSARLGPRDTALAGALSDLSRQDYGAACPRWRQMTERWPGEFTTWYGWAICQSQDDGIRPEPRSPSRWAFRSSYQQAQLAWRRAFTLHPVIYRDFSPSGRRPNQRILWTSTNRLRGGQAIPPDTGFFSAFPSWQGDTLAFIPYRDPDFYSDKALVAASNTQEAVRRQRRTYFDLASEWRSTSPTNPDAAEALATGLWLLGNPTASDTIHAARRQSERPANRVRLGVTEALMLVLRSAPEAGTLRRAASLIDSLLDQGTAVRLDPWDLATLAALTGRANTAARFIRMPSPRTVLALPLGLASDALALLAFGSLGGPAESLAVLERQVNQGIEAGVEPGRRLSARMEWLARPATIAFKEYPFPTLRELAGHDDYLTDAVVAYQKGDTAEVRHKLDEAVAGRIWMKAWDLSPETIHPEALLLAASGDSRGAIERLDPTLSTLRSASLDVFRNPVGAGMLVRAMALRADLASAMGDPETAARWATAVEILWSEADPFLQPIVRRMRQLAREGRA